MSNIAGFACVRLIADALSTLPLDVFERRGSSQVQVDPPAWFEEPDQGLDLGSWIYQAVTSDLLRSNMFGLVLDRQGLTPTVVRWLPPDQVTALVDGSGWLFRGQVIPRHDMLHTATMLLPGHRMGLAPVDIFRRFFDLGNSSQEFGARWFDDGAMPSAVLMHDAKMTTTQADASIEKWDADHKGRRRTALLSGGMRFEVVGPSAADSQFLETQKFVVNNSARIWGVLAEMIGGETGSNLHYTSPEMTAAHFGTFTLRPRAVRLEKLISRMLPPRQFAQFNIDAIIRASLLDRYQAHKVALDAGFKTKNEVRVLEDLPPLTTGEGDMTRPFVAPTPKI